MLRHAPSRPIIRVLRLASIAKAQPCVTTIGAFDGVHLGHQHVLKQVVEKAQQTGLISCVVLFEPHPKEFFQDPNKPALLRITRLRDKIALLQQHGIEQILVLPFNHKLSKLSAESFVKDILIDQLKAKHMIIGDDFHFGHQRRGNKALLEKMAPEYGFSISDCNTFLLDAQRVSSSIVRKAIAEGNFDLAQTLLGRPYTLCGTIKKGNQLGRTIGFPTINIGLNKPMATHGIYAVEVFGLTKNPLRGAASVGIRPTVKEQRRLLEVFLFDYHQECYGEYVEVQFHAKMRDEEKYDSIALLTAQIDKDVKNIQHYFTSKDKT